MVHIIVVNLIIISCYTYATPLTSGGELEHYYVSSNFNISTFFLQTAHLYDVFFSMEKGPKFWNFAYLEYILNFNVSSNFDVVIFFELIMTRDSGSIAVDFPYQLRCRVNLDCCKTGEGGSTCCGRIMLCLHYPFIFSKCHMKFLPALFKQILYNNDCYRTIIIFK